MWGCCPSPSVFWGASGRKASLLHQPYKYYRTPRWVDHCAKQCYNDACCCSLSISYHCVCGSPAVHALTFAFNSDCNSMVASQVLRQLSRATAAMFPQQNLLYCQASRHAAASNAVKQPVTATRCRRCKMLAVLQWFWSACRQSLLRL